MFYHQLLLCSILYRGGYSLDAYTSFSASSPDATVLRTSASGSTRPVALPPSKLVVVGIVPTDLTTNRLRGSDHKKKCEMYAGVTGSAVYDSNICYICELPPSNNTYNTVTKLCSNGESPFIYFSIYIP